MKINPMQINRPSSSNPQETPIDIEPPERLPKTALNHSTIDPYTTNPKEVLRAFGAELPTFPKELQILPLLIHGENP